MKEAKQQATSRADAGAFASVGDPLRARYGPARLSHPEEFDKTIDELRRAGVEIDFRPGSLAYSPCKAEPGRFIFDPEGSIGALRHEKRHFDDIQQAGYPGLSPYLRDSNLMWRIEYRGYMEEVTFARSQRDFESAREILDTMRRVKEDILGGSR